MSAQIPLGFNARERASFDNFLAGTNTPAIERLARFTGQPGEPVIYLCGPAGCGRTHLVQAVCNAASARGQSTVRIGLQAAERLPLAALDGMENVAVVCVDDLDAVAGEAAWEAALDALFGRLHHVGGGLLVTADRPVAELPHAGLRGRLEAAMSFALQPLDAAGRAALLAARAGRRGLLLPADVTALLLRHCSDHPARLIAALDTVEQVVLDGRRRLGVASVRTALKAVGLLD